MTYYGRKDYTYNGGDKFFTITFPYIKTEHVEVYINDVLTTNYTYLTESQISVSDTLTNGDVVSLRRNTPIDKRMVIFSNTSMLNKDNQNLAQEQMFYSVQENTDNNNEFTTQINSTISENQANITKEINTFKTQINSTISEVNQAAQTIETTIATVNSAVTTCTNKADIAVAKATEAVDAAATLTGTIEEVTENTSAIHEIKTDTTITKQGNTFNGTNQLVKMDGDKLPAVDGSQLTSLPLLGADKSLSNITTTGKSVISKLAMPSDTVINLTLGSSGSQYTAPAEGYLSLCKISTASGQGMQFYQEGQTTPFAHNIAISNNANQSGIYTMIYIPCKKGDLITYYYDLGGTTVFFKFVYAQGEV